MTGFFVRPDQVEKYGGLVQGHSGYLDQASKYGLSNARVDDADVGTIFKAIFDTHYDAQTMVCDYLDRLSEVCRASGTELFKAADMYRSVDQDTAEHLDGTYPGGPGPTPQQEPPARGISEYNFPPARLKPPGEPEDFEDPGGVVDQISDLLSPAKWIQEPGLGDRGQPDREGG